MCILNVLLLDVLSPKDRRRQSTRAHARVRTVRWENGFATRLPWEASFPGFPWSAWEPLRQLIEDDHGLEQGVVHWHGIISNADKARVRMHGSEP